MPHHDREYPECQGEYQSWHDPVHRLGIGECFPWQDETELNRWLVEPTGIPLEEYAAHPEGIRYARIPRREVAGPAPGGPPAARSSEVELHPADAAALGVVDGEPVRVTSRIGSLEIPVKVMARNEILPGNLQIAHGWREANVNLLTHDDRFDPINVLSHAFPDSAHVVSLGLSGASDEQIWAYARENGFCIHTKDADFPQLSFLYGPPPKVLWLQTPNRPTWEIARLLEDHLEEIRHFASSEEASMIIRQLP